MIKFIQCVKGKKGLSVSEFRQHWDVYQGKVRACAEMLNAFSVTANTTLQIEQNHMVMMARGTDIPFDGVIEMCIENAADLPKIMDKEDVKTKIKDMQTYQEKFMDLEDSSFFFTMEDEIYHRP